MNTEVCSFYISNRINDIIKRTIATWNGDRKVTFLWGFAACGNFHFTELYLAQIAVFSSNGILEVYTSKEVIEQEIDVVAIFFFSALILKFTKFDVSCGRGGGNRCIESLHSCDDANIGWSYCINSVEVDDGFVFIAAVV